MMLHRFSYLIAFFLVFWATDIGPEEKINGGKGKPIAKPILTKIPEFNGDSNKKFTRPRIKIKKVFPIDKEQFLITFKRQSRLGLLHCLREWRESPASVIVSGRLYQTGHLKKVEGIDMASQLPECFHESVGSMLFQDVASILPKLEWQSIQWRIDW